MKKLNHAATVQQEILAEAQAIDDAPGLGKTERILQDIWSRETRTRTNRRRGLAWLALAAAALLVLAWLFLWTDPPASGPGTNYLQGWQLTLDRESRFERIQWTSPAARGCYFLVEVRPAGSTPTDPAIYQSDPLDEPLLELPPEMTHTWPDEIDLYIEAFSAGKASLGAATGTLSRSSRSR